ncbi:uncharacterized protein PGTG_18496 [Puccinia graminis f. sp. tritici CRL 75-36-700-3]|uniref:Uncharacterized protein n=1 Tax=Puccinia graminis f. sp. tritici (strain CRL 75-36-700-3 / race SCCL) TaxID=418459 RepID=E3L6V6_PUCGT|nr:uncharacterized protein PGTG_18496 [Puccinia graminis f. sp. tritici CRL 75-36-700-3]EFP92281.1 hypothetical protein PGTG_18496 [Puccinia graminis f. sp. tritici CRL 75-36-700-3]
MAIATCSFVMSVDWFMNVNGRPSVMPSAERRRGCIMYDLVVAVAAALILFFGTIKLCAGELINCDRDPKACEERGGSRSHNPYCPGLPPNMQARCCENGRSLIYFGGPRS